MPAVLSIDAGTTGVTALIIRDDATIAARGYREFPQHFPQPGWVEHDPEQIWDATVGAIGHALVTADMKMGEIVAIGITDQRETTVLWERESLRPVHNAIVWQDRRTAGRCDELRDHEAMIRSKTGLVVDAYFSATKLEWLLGHLEPHGAAAFEGKLAFGTIDTWLIAKLTGGSAHVTDPSNASRTMLYDIYRGDWDLELLQLFEVPMEVLPSVQPSSGTFGEAHLFDATVPITGVAGDQQAALFGQACIEPGMTKNTYGTGSFVLMNTGTTAPPPPDGMLVTIAWGLGGEITYALEGSIFITGAAIQWLRDGLGIIENAAETGPLAATVADTGGVYFVPALTGLGSPYWDQYARGTIVGITRGTTRAHLARAAVEAMAFQTRDVMEAMAREAGIRPTDLRVDGGASVMDLLCQIQADQLSIPVRRPEIQETTALGAAFLAGLAEGVWGSTDEIAATWRLDEEFEPTADRTEADERYGEWARAVERARGWAT